MDNKVHITWNKERDVCCIDSCILVHTETREVQWSGLSIRDVYLRLKEARMQDDLLRAYDSQIAPIDYFWCRLPFGITALFTKLRLVNGWRRVR